MPQRPEYEVVVLGGGPAGCATAMALRQQGVATVLVVEAGHYEVDVVGEAIPPDTRLLLQQLGVWQDFLNEQHDPCVGSCSSWGSKELGYNDFLFNPQGYGWHLNRRRFNAFLAEQAEQSGAELWRGMRFETAVRSDDGGYYLRLVSAGESMQTVYTRFVLDATGMRSVFARHRGAKRHFLDRLICVYGFFEVSDAVPFSQLTMLEAISYGWWYAARLPQGRVAVAVASDPEFVKHAQMRQPEYWLSHLASTRHLATALAGCRFVSERLLVRSAASFMLSRAVDDGWLAVGDAASAFDPIAAQGIYKSLVTSLEAAPAIVSYLDGDASGLETYQTTITERFDAYLTIRNYFYGLETRWPASPFWQRRHDRTSL